MALAQPRRAQVVPLPRARVRVYLMIQSGEVKRGAGLTVLLYRVDSLLPLEVREICDAYQSRIKAIPETYAALKASWIDSACMSVADARSAGADITRQEHDVAGRGHRRVHPLGVVRGELQVQIGPRPHRGEGGTHRDSSGRAK